MALMHSTTLVPSKLELLAAWLPTQPWFTGDSSRLQSLGSYRLDDPAGDVGMEGHLLTAGDDRVYHVPLSYRAAPLSDEVEGGEAFGVGTSEHGVLGTRWLSDAIGDPVFRATLASTIARGGHEAAEFVAQPDGTATPRELHTRVRGSGHPDAEVPDLSDATVETGSTVSRASTPTAILELLRVLDPTGAPGEALDPKAQVLSVHWERSEWPAVGAILRAV